MKEGQPGWYNTDNKNPLKNKVAAVAILLGLTACDKPITEGVVYKKEREEEVVRLHPFWAAHPAFFRADVLAERNEVYIAQCSTKKMPRQESLYLLAGESASLHSPFPRIHPPHLRAAEACHDVMARRARRSQPRAVRRRSPELEPRPRIYCKLRFPNDSPRLRSSETRRKAASAVECLTIDLGGTNAQ